jgi:hypothetical protein
MHGSTSQHRTAQDSASPRVVVGAMHRTLDDCRHVEMLGFHWPEAVRVFLHAQSRLLACMTSGPLISLYSTILEFKVLLSREQRKDSIDLMRFRKQMKLISICVVLTCCVHMHQAITASVQLNGNQNFFTSLMSKSNQLSGR